MSEHGICPLCGKEFTPENGLTPEEHLAKGVLTRYRQLQENPPAEYVLPCPRCGSGQMEQKIEKAKFSRHGDICICSDCEVDEERRAASNTRDLPSTDWFIVKQILKISE